MHIIYILLELLRGGPLHPLLKSFTHPFIENLVYPSHLFLKLCDHTLIIPKKIQLFPIYFLQNCALLLHQKYRGLKNEIFILLI